MAKQKQTLKGTQIMNKQIEIGQKWMTRRGEEVVIVDHDRRRRYPWIASNRSSYTDDGQYSASGRFAMNDLLVCVEEANHPSNVQYLAISNVQYLATIAHDIAKMLSANELVSDEARKLYSQAVELLAKAKTA